MKVEKKIKPKNLGQKIQDKIFREMSADKKLAIGSGLWRLGRELLSNKSKYEISRPPSSLKFKYGVPKRVG